MKRKLFLSILLLVTFMSLSGKNTIEMTNQQLRTLFESIPHPNNINFCYDMACHLIDSAYYDTTCKLESNADVWFYLYEEMYHAAFDTTYLPIADSIVSHSNQYFCDTIPLGVIDWRYVHFPENILEIDLDKYYICNESAGKLEGRDDDMSLLKTAEVFMVSPLQLETRTLHPVFLLNFDFFFTDLDVTQENTFWEGEIDFGDGNGWQPISANSAIPVHYPAAGDYQIQVRTQQDGISKYSTSTIRVNGNDNIYIPKYSENEADIDGLREFRFDPECDVNEDKLLFVLAGYNPKSFINSGVRTASELYEKYIVKGNLEPLRDFGYTIIIVDYVNHNDSIENNAMRVARLLSYYRCHQQGNEQFVVMGHSMGCLVGRYALTWLEKHPATYSDCNIEKLHNTRLFISNDGPHQGVNIPLSLQCLYGYILDKNEITQNILEKLSARTRYNLNISTTLLRGYSVKQMLYYHYSTDVLKIGYYRAHPLHTAFLYNMMQLGDYPQYCKMVALSNGSMQGFGQQTNYSVNDAGRFRTAGDHLLKFNAELGVTVLGLRFDNSCAIDLLSNPSTPGSLGYIQTESSVAIVGLLSGRILCRASIDKDVVDFPDKTKLQPYCVSAAGNEYVYNFGLNANFQPLCIWADIFPAWGFSAEQAPGYFSLGVRIGTPWSFNIHGTAGFYSDGLGFGFVPTQSAFDYREEKALNIDYTQLDITKMFENTPFDALIGRMHGIRHDGEEMSDFANFNHEDINNQPIANRRIAYKEGDKNDKKLASHYVVTDSVSRLLAREIGDEELYLNNSYLFDYKHHTTYDAVYRIYVQRDSTCHRTHNPYYKTALFDGKTTDDYGNEHTYKVDGSYARDGRWDCNASSVPIFSCSEYTIMDDDTFNFIETHNVVNQCILMLLTNAPKKLLYYPRDKKITQDAEYQSGNRYIYTIDGKFVGKYNVEDIELHGVYIAFPEETKATSQPTLLIL